MYQQSYHLVFTFTTILTFMVLLSAIPPMLGSRFSSAAGIGSMSAFLGGGRLRVIIWYVQPPGDGCFSALVFLSEPPWASFCLSISSSLILSRVFFPSLSASPAVHSWPNLETKACPQLGERLIKTGQWLTWKKTSTRRTPQKTKTDGWNDG